MVANLLFMKPVDIAIAQSGCFVLETGEDLSVDTVPAVRYRFYDYKLEELEFIKKCLSLFPKSLHIAEVRYNGNYEQEIPLIASMENVAIFMRVQLDNADVELDRLTPDKVNTLRFLKGDSANSRPLINFVSKIVLVDHSTTLHMLSAHKIKTFVANEFKKKEKYITFCNSPITQAEAEGACLSANLARELGAEFGQVEDMVIATNAIEGRNCSQTCACTCLKHIMVENEIKAATGKVGAKVKKDLSDLPTKKVADSFMNLPANYEVDGQLEMNGSSGEIYLPKKEKPKKKPKLPKGVLTRY